MRFWLQRNKRNCKQYRRSNHDVSGWDSASKEEPPRHPDPQLWAPDLPGPLHGRAITEVPCRQNLRMHSGVPEKVSRGAVSLEVTKPPKAGNLPVGCPTCHGLSEHVLILKQKISYALSPGFLGKVSGHQGLLAAVHSTEAEHWGNCMHIQSPMLQKPLMLQALGTEGAMCCRSWELEKLAAHAAGGQAPEKSPSLQEPRAIQESTQWAHQNQYAKPSPPAVSSQCSFLTKLKSQPTCEEKILKGPWAIVT